VRPQVAPPVTLPLLSWNSLPLVSWIRAVGSASRYACRPADAAPLTLSAGGDNFRRAAALTGSTGRAWRLYRILRGSFALALRRGIVTRTPLDGLAASEVPKQKNARPIAVPDDAGIVS